MKLTIQAHAFGPQKQTRYICSVTTTGGSTTAETFDGQNTLAEVFNALRVKEKVIRLYPEPGGAA